MGNNKSELVVAAIENGTVIDHIPAEKTYQVVNLLQLEKMDTPVTIGYNLPSKKIGKKRIIKVANKYFTDEEINRLSVVAPNIGLSIIKDYEIVEKKTVKTPDTLKGIVKCNNPKCITNNEPMATIFHTVDKALGIVRCHYCDKEQQLGKVELCNFTMQFKNFALLNSTKKPYEKRKSFSPSVYALKSYGRLQSFPEIRSISWQMADESGVW